MPFVRIHVGIRVENHTSSNVHTDSGYPRFQSIDFGYHLKFISTNPVTVSCQQIGGKTIHHVTAFFRKTDAANGGVEGTANVPNRFALKSPIDFDEHVGRLVIKVLDDNDVEIASHNISLNGGNGDPDDLIFPTMPVEFPTGPVIPPGN